MDVSEYDEDIGIEEYHVPDSISKQGMFYIYGKVKLYMISKSP